MPLPLTKHSDAITEAVEVALVKSGAFNPITDVRESLNAAGADIEAVATSLANLIFSAKDSVKLRAIENALKIHGISMETDSNNRGAPIINIQVVSDGNTNLNGIFAPERNF
jgi:hypothetical protein